MSPLRVALSSPDPLARSGLAALLEREGIVVLSSDEAGADAWVVDLASDAAVEAIRAAPAPVVALLSSDGDTADALAAGARALVPRDAPGDRIAAAIGAVVHGLVALDGALAPSLLRPAAPRATGELTPREAEVLAELAEGRSNKEIARALGVSERTAKFHVESILAKLGAESRSEAIVRAARLGLVVL